MKQFWEKEDCKTRLRDRYSKTLRLALPTDDWEGEKAVADYRRFLTTGGSGHPIDLLRIAGVDMASPKPVLDTIDTFRSTLQELKALLPAAEKADQ